MPQQLDPLTQLLIQKAVANPPESFQRALHPTVGAPNIPGQPGLYGDKEVSPELLGARNWFLQKAKGVTDPVELNRLYQISKGPGAQDTTPLDMPYTIGGRK